MVLLPGAEPFAFDGGPTGALLVHGLTGCPASMRAWGDYLAEAGLTVVGPRLPGHGTRVEDMAATRWEDWYAEAERSYRALRARCDEVFVMGLSMGAALVLRLAETRPGEIAGAVLVNAAIASNDRRLIVLPVLKHVVKTFPGIGNDIKKPGVTEVAYDRTPLKPVASMLEGWKAVRADLGKVDCPVLHFRSSQDHVVDPGSSALLHRGLPRLQEVVLEDSYHVATLDNDAKRIFRGSLDFVRENSRTVPG